MRYTSLIIAAVACLLLAGCMADQLTTSAEARLNPTLGETASGVLDFTLGYEGMRVEGAITGLSPGDHGFHIHEVGDCSAPDGSSAKGHFNPHQRGHGAPDNDIRHVGDLGNILADERGIALVNLTDDKLSFEGPASIIGRAVIVHADPDDLYSQPSGAAGSRVACGIIR